ncbi:MAG: sulfur oxidation c-type cytochrome SoxA [Burkholderiaceae bacterium]|nr:sulfur oxidation c-type cytochrome SoxA [Burkholderiaceae bacterium]
MKWAFRGPRAFVGWAAAVAGAAAIGACATVVEPVTSKEWKTRASDLSQGRIVEVDGKKVQRRYPVFGAPTNFEDWPTYATGSKTYFPPQKAQFPANLKGDPKRGHELLKNSAKGPCTACHVIPDVTVWPAGNVGPDLRAIGARGISDDFLYQIIWDPRVLYGEETPMAPFGASGMWTPQEIMDAVAYLQSLKGNPPGQPEKVTDDKQWDPRTRDVVRPEYGDPLDPTANPGVALTEAIAVPLWNQKGPKGRSCADCHGAIGAPDEKRTLGVIKSMVGVATRYPKWFGEYRRMMSIEDFLAVHAPETTGIELPSQADPNMTMAILIKMQSYDMPYAIDLKNPNVQAAIKRGEELFKRRVGQRGQACIHCHTERGGGRKFLGGRFLADVEKDAMVNHPYWRTNWNQLIDIRMRFQWCMTPLRANMLPGDAPEYADLETYIVAKQTQRGDRLQVPRLAH